VLPLYPLYLGINAFIKDEIISFIILCSITAVLVLLAFLKKPALLGSDVAYIQEDFIEMFKKKKKKKNLAAQTVSESSININE
jgi:hypothetical protein